MFDRRIVSASKIVDHNNETKIHCLIGDLSFIVQGNLFIKEVI